MMREVIAASSAAISPELGIWVNHQLGTKPDYVLITAKANAKFWFVNSNGAQVQIAADVASAPFQMLCIKDHSLIK